MNCKVSVSIITYNHEPFIAQAIESVLMQETGFEYEILIGEDDSSDRTREIVTGYQQRYPDKIRLFLNDRQNVIYVSGQPTGRWNLVNNLKHARGQYVALLDGDDYWTSSTKLQAQVDFLDAHPECAICFHDAEKRYEAGAIKPQKTARPRYRAFYAIEDLLERNFIRTCTVMFRNRLFGEFPDWFYTTPMADWPLHVLNAQHGDIGYIDLVMAVHRVHSNSLWSPRSAVQRRRAAVETLKTFRQNLDPRYDRKLEESIARWHFKVLNALRLEGNYREIAHYLGALPRRRDVSWSALLHAAGWAMQGWIRSGGGG